jgi:hypothetical protein
MRPRPITHRLSFEQRQALRDTEFNRLLRRAQGPRWYDVRPGMVWLIPAASLVLLAVELLP